MKKIVLGCAAVLLSLGLLAGCNNKEDEPPITEAVSLSVSQTSVNLEPGGSTSVTYTVNPTDATVMALSDHEEYVTAVAQNGTIYLEAVAAGSAIVSVGAEYEGYASAEAQINVTVAEVLEPEPVVPTVSLTVNSLGWLTTESEPVELTWSVDPEEATVIPSLKEETEAIDLEEKDGGWWVTPKAEGNATIVVDATYTSDEGIEYTPASEEVTVKIHAAGEEAPTEVSGIVISIALTYDSTPSYTLPEWLDIYLLGDWASPDYSDTTAAVKLEYDESSQVYTTTIGQSLTVGEWYHYYLFAVYNTGLYEGQISWERQLNSSVEYFEIESGTEDGAVISMPFTLPEGFEEKYPNPNAEGTVQQQTNHTINFFFVDNEEEPSTYYEIPEYADGYLTGYLVNGAWVNYEINGTGKLSANGSTAEEGYSVTYDVIDTGELNANIIFEFNANSTHGAATEATWNYTHSVFGSKEGGTIIIDNTDGADHSDVYLACDPSSIIDDDEQQAYALVGDFSDSSWNESPDTESKYYLAPGQTEWTISDVAMSSGGKVRVVEYGSWTTVAGFTELDPASSGCQNYAGDSNNIVLSLTATYTFVVTVTDTVWSILVTAQQ